MQYSNSIFNTDNTSKSKEGDNSMPIAVNDYMSILMETTIPYLIMR